MVNITADDGVIWENCVVVVGNYVLMDGTAGIVSREDGVERCNTI
jgi:hypothetical protein